MESLNYKHVAAEMRYDGMDKNLFAVMPPMGWNSYDYYDTSVTEEQVKANADYMAKHLKQYGCRQSTRSLPVYTILGCCHG